MTLLVLEIAIPDLSHSEAITELPKELFKLWSLFLSYATSFIILGLFWITNQNLFHYIKRANLTLIWITIFYLMFIALIPFSTSLIGEYGDQQISVIIYGVNIVVAGALAYLQWWYATRNLHLVNSDLDPIFVMLVSRRITVGLAIFLIAIAVSFLSIPASLILYIVAPAYYLIPIRMEKSRFWFNKKSK